MNRWAHLQGGDVTGLGCVNLGWRGLTQAVRVGTDNGTSHGSLLVNGGLRG